MSEFTCKIVTAKTPAVLERGEVLYGSQFLSQVQTSLPGHLLRHLEGKPYYRKRLVQTSLDFFSLFSIAGAARLGVDISVLNDHAIYKCPWSGNKYHWMFPLGIITDKEERYGQHEPGKCRLISSHEESMDYVCPQPYDCGKIIDAMMGHGYTCGTSPTDGSGTKILANVPLDNGDEILVVCWVWFNK